MKKVKIRQKDLIAAIEKASGKISAVARHFDVSTVTIYDRIKKNPKVEEAVENARNHFDESLCDIAEAKLYTAVNAGASWAIRYSLACKAKDRGYIEKSIIESQNKNVNINFMAPSQYETPEEWEAQQNKEKK